MRGKIVNLVLSIMNVLLGALIIVYSIFIPKDMDVTSQELIVINCVRLVGIATFIGIRYYGYNFCFYKQKRTRIMYCFFIAFVISCIFYMATDLDFGSANSCELNNYNS